MAGIVLHMLASLLMHVCAEHRGSAWHARCRAWAPPLRGRLAIAAWATRYADSDCRDGAVMSRLDAGRGLRQWWRPPRWAPPCLLKASWQWVFDRWWFWQAGLIILAARMRCQKPAHVDIDGAEVRWHRRHLRRAACATPVFVILVLVAALGMSGLFSLYRRWSFVLQGHYALTSSISAGVRRRGGRHDRLPHS